MAELENYYGSYQIQTIAFQVMRRIIDKLRDLGCNKIDHIETSDSGGERLISRATGVEIAYLDRVDFRLLFSNPRGEELPFLPGGLPPPGDIRLLMDVVSAVFRWLKEESLRDGYVVIYAYTDAAARETAFEVLGQKWSSLSRVPCDSKLFPDGACGHPIIADDHEP